MFELSVLSFSFIFPYWLTFECILLYLLRFQDIFAIFTLLFITGKIEGRRVVRRKQVSGLKNIQDATRIRNEGQLLHMAENREAFAIAIANVG